MKHNRYASEQAFKTQAPQAICEVGMGSETIGNAGQPDGRAVRQSGPAAAMVLNLVVASGYVSSLIGNSRVSGYLERHHPEILTEFKAIVAAASLEEPVTTSSEEPAILG